MSKAPEPNMKKLPRRHAYIHMRNGGHSIDIDYPDVDSAQAGRIITAVMAIVREEIDSETDANATLPAR